MTEQTLV